MCSVRYIDFATTPTTKMASSSSCADDVKIGEKNEVPASSAIKAEV